jgi:hypothetical protein
VIAALFVQTGGVYFGIPDVDPWDEARDARNYDGPNPVVAHPPCARWGNYWFGSPSGSKRFKLGDDDGCFLAALWCVRAFGGVLEHPSGSRAWTYFNLNTPPHKGGWIQADTCGGWTCRVEQGHYGHRARKASWLYYAGLKNPPDLIWGPSQSALSRTRARSSALERLSKRERAQTPVPFRDLLLDIARSCR